MKLRIGDMVTTSELANSLDEPVSLYSEALVPWDIENIQTVGSFSKNQTATILATHHDDSRSVYIMGDGIMGWILSAYLRKYVSNNSYQELG